MKCFLLVFKNEIQVNLDLLVIVETQNQMVSHIIRCNSKGIGELL